MKKAALIINMLLITIFSFGQSTHFINYQSVVRDGNGKLLKNKNVSIRLSIHKSAANGPREYQEIHNITTNEFGLINLKIGGGNIVSGDYTSIDWGKDKHFLKIDLDINGGTAFTDMGTQELVSVPYALYAIETKYSQNSSLSDTALYAKNAAIADSIRGGFPESNWILENGNLIKSQGINVGIGTNSPMAMLDVSRDIRVNGLTIGIGGGFGSNTSFGKEVLDSCQQCFDNAAFGFAALSNLTTGVRNTAIGARALENITTGERNVAVGHLAGVGVADSGITNSIVIGNRASVNANNKALIGNGSMTSIGGQVAWTSFSDARIKDSVQQNVVGLPFITALKPITFHYSIDKQNELNGVQDSSDWEGKKDIEKIAFSGFLAQEVQAAADSVGYNFSGVDTSGKVMGIRYAEFAAPLVKSIQEQQDQIIALKKANAELYQMILALKLQMNPVEITNKK